MNVPHAAADQSPVSSDVRVRIFVDYWNFQLGMNEWRAKFPLDWKRLGPWTAEQAGQLFLNAGQRGRVRYEGMHVYMSYNPLKRADDDFKRWATNVLDGFPGVEVTIKERRPRDAPKCPSCHEAVIDCPQCRKSMRGTMEKGIDTAIVTDMIRLAWEGAWDLAVLLSADADFVPAVEFLNQKGHKVIHGRFPPRGADLARKCWASFDISKNLDDLERQTGPVSHPPI